MSDLTPQSTTPVTPTVVRDFSLGRYAKSAINSYLVPRNSVSFSRNINFDTILGSAVVRNGTTIVVSSTTSANTPLGLIEFVTSGNVLNLVVVVYAGASNATLYYMDTAWRTSGLTALSNTAKIRFAQIGNRLFMVNGSDAMKSSADANVWNTTNCIIDNSVNPTIIYRAKNRLLASGYSGFRSRIYFSSVISPNVTTKSTTITSAAGVATATSTAHGYVVGNFVTISGATQPEYNGTFKVATTPTADTFTFVVSGGPASPATGTIISSLAQISWNTDPQTGDWIDINPDDGSDITAISETATVNLVFKANGMYRVNVITKTVDTENIFNIGAVSQEAVVVCQGITYFYSGIDIRRTNGGYPEQISRLGVQDFLDAIPEANKSVVSMGTDGLNVYIQIGNITLGTGTDDETSYTNCVLKFSPRDESWSFHTYFRAFKLFTQYKLTGNPRRMIGANTNGSVHSINLGLNDGAAGTPIFYELETQELELGNRSHTNKISDKIVVFSKGAGGSSVQYRPEDDDLIDIDINMTDRVNISDDVNFEGKYLTLRWSGQSINTPPILEGFYIEEIVDQGISG